MDVELRPVTTDELSELSRAVMWAFGASSKEYFENATSVLEPDRTLAVFDDGRIVAGTGLLSVELTVPGPRLVPAAGVTWTGVVPTHRRRGLLTALMSRQLDDVAARGEAVAVLLASESPIYGRFGYGPATAVLGGEIEQSHATFRSPPQPTGARLRALDADETAEALPRVFDRYRVAQPGEVSRSAGWWQTLLRDPESEREGATARFAVVHEEPDATATGYVTYRLKHDWSGGVPGHLLIVEELVAATAAARAALWHYCFNLDLVRTIELSHVPVDDPLRWMLVDSRRLRVTRWTDFLWARLVDVERALSDRRYSVSGGVVVDVVDRFRPQSTGRYRLEGGPDGAECRRTDEPADLALDIADLGAAYLGGTAFETLARAGRVDELRAGALARADALFATRPAPWCSTDF